MMMSSGLTKAQLEQVVSLRAGENKKLRKIASDMLAALKLAHQALGESRGYHQSTTATTIRAAIAAAEAAGIKAEG